jgi:Ca2+/Na+ antiporter
VTLAIILLLAGALVLGVGARAGRGAIGSVAMRFLPGVTLEGLAVALVASAEGATAVVPGLAFGSAMVLIALGFGASALRARRPVAAPEPGAVLIPAAPLVATAFTLADQVVTRVEGAGLLVVFAASVLLREPREDERPADTNQERPGAIRVPPIRTVWLVLWLAVMYVGARVVLAGGDRFFGLVGLQAGFVGAAVMAPIVALRFILKRGSPRRRGADMGAKAFDPIAGFCSAVLGAAALLRPLPVDGASSYAFLALALMYVALSAAFLAMGRAWRVTGAALLGVYGLWMALASML